MAQASYKWGHINDIRNALGQGIDPSDCGAHARTNACVGR
jgi:hypothetical protein